MAQQTEDLKSESGLRGESEEAIDMTQYKKRFEDAVDKAQYLMSYASSKCPKDIDRDTIEKLINARHHLENKQELSAKDETDFWLAYQDLWKLVDPVTADSIKANLPIENISTSKLLEKMPVLSRWWGTKTPSKSRRTVNKYIGFTAVVLILLLIFQIYWVIGNQLTTQLDEQLKAEADLSLQINKNKQEYSALEIRYKQNEIDSKSFNGTYAFYSSPAWERDILENSYTKARLETDMESLKTQLERSSAILLIWSSPWSGLIDIEPGAANSTSSTGESIQLESINDKYAPQIESIDAQIKVIEAQQLADSDGKKAADILNSTLSPQLKSMDLQLSDLYTKNDEMNLQEVEIQRQIEEIQNKLKALSGDATANEGQSIESILNAQLSDLEGQLTELDATIAVVEGQIEEIRNKLSIPADDPTTDESRKSALEAGLNDLQVQLTDLGARKAVIEVQKGEIKNQLRVLLDNANAGESLISILQTQSKDLNAQLTDLKAHKAVNGDQIQGLQSQRNDLNAQMVPAAKIVSQWIQDKERLTNEMKVLKRQELADASREKSRQAQLAGQFVLVILQSYLLPLLYGILGAGTSVLRFLSNQIETVTYSEEAGIKHLLRVSLGALAGIMVGWFSFLLPNESTSFLGSVSPLAVAFLVGYNIELFFSLMDSAINWVNKKQETNANNDGTQNPTSSGKKEGKTGDSALTTPK